LHDGALVGGKFGERGGEGGAEIFFVGIFRGREKFQSFGGELFVVFGARAASAHEVNSGVVGETEEEGAFIAGSGEEVGLTSEFGENFLQHFAGIVLVAREVEEEREQCRSLLVIQAGDFLAHCSLNKDASGMQFCLGKIICEFL
ncbi:MAG: hypothetical protein RL380_724, partial [Verrucomicrobiota bacterium]